MQGRFDYRDIGLLDRTHKTFFTRESLERMLDEADLGLVVLHRHDLVFDASEVPFDAAGVPGEVRRRLDEDPDARTYQFVVQALPMAQPGMRALQERMREQAGARADVELQRDDLALALEHARAEADELGAAIAKLTGREGELRRALIEANDALLEREAEIDLLRREVGRVSELRSGDQAWSGEQAKAIEQQVGQIRDLNVQLRRYRRTSVLGIDPTDPWRLTCDPVRIVSAEYGWDHEVAEGRFALRYGDRLVVTYSGSAVGPTYAVGAIEARSGADLLDPGTWTRRPRRCSVPATTSALGARSQYVQPRRGRPQARRLPRPSRRSPRVDGARRCVTSTGRPTGTWCSISGPMRRSRHTCAGCTRSCGSLRPRRQPTGPLNVDVARLGTNLGSRPAKESTAMRFEHRGAEAGASVVDRVWRTRSDAADSMTSAARTCCQLILTRTRGRLHAGLRGPETRATTTPVPAEAEFLGIRFTLGVVLRPHPAFSIVDGQAALPVTDSGRIVIGGENWEAPTYENVEHFVRRLQGAGLLVRSSSTWRVRPTRRTVSGAIARSPGCRRPP